MLKRNDLAKQFELVVQQEIKNYNESLSTILQRLNFLKDDIEKTENMSLENHAMVFSLFKSLENLVEKYRQHQSTSNQALESKINDLKAKNESHNKAMVSFVSLLDDFSKRLDGLDRTIQSLDVEIKNLSQNFSKLHRQLGNEISSLDFRLNKNISKFKEEILSKPSDSEEFKKGIDERLSSHIVDVAGIMREMRLNRHDMMVIEKKIENIYTLIERLQKSEVKP